MATEYFVKFIESSDRSLAVLSDINLRGARNNANEFYIL